MPAIASSTVRSMTGQGHAQSQGDLGTLSVEVRTVNHRGFKCVTRLSDSLTAYESHVEAAARKLIRRGSVYINVAWHRPAAENMPSINQDVLVAYAQQLAQAQASTQADTTVDLAALLLLPGVMGPQLDKSRDDADVIEFVTKVVGEAIENLNQMRQVEGGNMCTSLQEDCDTIRQHVETISGLAPRAVDTYRTRLETKIKNAISEHQLNIDSFDLLREVQVYADRSDISEELTRLASHLEMFLGVLDGKASEGGEKQPEPTGRKLDFIIQELFRETNTIGSKAADAEISANVVEIKCAIERMRELVQNLE